MTYYVVANIGNRSSSEGTDLRYVGADREEAIRVWKKLTGEEELVCYGNWNEWPENVIGLVSTHNWAGALYECREPLTSSQL